MSRKNIGARPTNISLRSFQSQPWEIITDFARGRLSQHPTPWSPLTRMTRHDCPAYFPRQGTCQDTERSPNLTSLTTNRLPDEVLLEEFDSYRQSIVIFDRPWRREYAWFNLAHVCCAEGGAQSCSRRPPLWI
jgi:hypothetical protein